MSIFELIRRDSKEPLRYSYPVGTITVEFQFFEIARKKPFDASSIANLLDGAESITVSIHDKIEDKSSRVKASFSKSELLAITENRFPDADNIERLRQAIIEKRYQDKAGKYEPNDKSFDAQGQTKKPGSHSEKKHK